MCCVGYCFAADGSNLDGAAEGASHFTSRENQIYQANVGPAMKRIFDAHFSDVAVKRPGAYLAAMHACAKERSRARNSVWL